MWNTRDLFQQESNVKSENASIQYSNTVFTDEVRDLELGVLHPLDDNLYGSGERTDLDDYESVNTLLYCGALRLITETK